ncbi:hypothetical protein LZ318_40105 [Saccharopolyspora indica]|uniref:hypothetical protein n=1 Tax=Saccharopolyspora indica TaxID=1229659 RepID=UPI0022EA90BC|nr:hypothetical protein [Saccharopolyspora indica]MDA3650186.1 hypothetical protein [Saccharopolyspora indica]
MSEGDGGTYQPVDQRQIQAMQAMPGPAGFMGGVVNVMTRAADNAALAAAQAAGGSMLVDPDQVDKLAQFFRGEAEELRARQSENYVLASVEPPGSDPVSTQAAEKYGSVGSGNPESYLDNYLKLADLFDQVAERLEQGANQNRIDDQNAADSMRGGRLA